MSRRSGRLWIALASVMAREVSYRSRRRKERRASSVTSLLGGTLRSNLLSAVFFSTLSLLLSAALALDPSSKPLFCVIFSTLFFAEFLLSCLMSGTVSFMVVSDRLLDPVSRLPIPEGEIRKALFALVMYLGGASLLMLVIPASVVGALVASAPLLIPSCALMALAVLAFSQGIGLAVGALAVRMEKSRLGRAILTIGWILFLGLNLILNFLPVEAVGPPPLGQLPPLSAVSLGLGELGLTQIAATSAALLVSALSFSLGAGFFWRAAVGWAPAARISAARPWSVRTAVHPWISKDLKLLSRRPKLLAGVIYVVAVLPLAVLAPPIPAFSEDPEFLAAILPGLAMWLGSLAGFAVSNFYYVEGEGARMLYMLPIDRKTLCRVKLTSAMAVVAPASLGVGILSLLASPRSAVSSVASYLLSSLASASIASIIHAVGAPREPTFWSEASFGRWRIAVSTLLAFLLSTFLSAASVARDLLGLRWLPSSAVLAPALSAVYALASLSLSELIVEGPLSG